MNIVYGIDCKLNIPASLAWAIANATDEAKEDIIL